MCALPAGGLGVIIDNTAGAATEGHRRPAVGPHADGAAAAAAFDAGGAREDGAARAAWRRLRLIAVALADDLAARDWRAPPRPWWPDFFARFALPAPRPPWPTVAPLAQSSSAASTSLHQHHHRRNPRLQKKRAAAIVRQTGRIRALASAWAARVALNSHLYQSNYVVAVGIALVIYVARKPWASFVVAAITVVCVRATAPRPLVVRSRRITKRERLAAAALFSTILLVATGLMPSFLKLALRCALLILLHASLRHSHVRAHLGDIGLRKDDW